MTNKWLKVALMATAIATGTSINIDAETVLYVPQDDRPVSLHDSAGGTQSKFMGFQSLPQFGITNSI